MRYAGTMRYACEEIDSIWSEQSKLTRWWQVWHAQLQACGQYPHPLQIQPVWFVANELEKTMGHDVAAAVAAFQDGFVSTGQPEAARWLHYGLCSSDVVDASYLLAIREATDELWQLSLRVIDALRELSKNSIGVQTLYRTHGQAAQVAAGDARWAGYAHEFVIANEMMREARPAAIGLQGPTGTGGELDQHQRDQIIATLGLRAVGRTGRQAADRTQWALWSHAVSSLATLAQRVATQIRLLAYEEVGEVTEGRDDAYRASSSMPHKSAGGRSNPTRSERICGMAAVIRGLANGYAEACSSVWDSHSLEHSCADRILLPQITGYTGFVLVELADVLRTLKVNPEAVKENTKGAYRQWPGEFLPNGDWVHLDSYQKRNRLIREGAGGDTWKAAQS